MKFNIRFLLVLMPGMIGLLLFQSCDEFLLKKTVSVNSLQGEINFDPNNTSISGNLVYDIENNQTGSLSEIYFISHNIVSVDYVTYKGDVLRFEQGLGYGSGIYRIRIPILKSGENARIEIKFHISGPMNEDRFQLAKDFVFIDAEKIWLPVPFAQEPKFFYSIKIRTPEDYYSVLGGKMKDESVKNGKRVVTWDSEIDDVLLTGNLFIGKENRLKNENIYLYTKNTNYSDLILNYSQESLTVISNYLGQYPFSQVHIINELIQYQDMDEQIDGEAKANLIEVSPDLTTNELISEESISNSIVPNIPRYSEWKLFETIAHEFSHAYVRGILKFEDDSYLESESLAEYTGLSVISTYNNPVYEKFIQRNRTELINLFLSKRPLPKQFKYLYGVNCLHAAFLGNNDIYFGFFKTMLEKYRYTDISLDEIVSTAQETGYQYKINDQDIADSLNVGLDANALRLWNKYELYNVELTYTSILQTNVVHRNTQIEERKMVTLNNEFPINLDLVLFETYSNRVETNLVRLQKNSLTNLLMDKDIASVDSYNRYENLENNLQDNSIRFTPENNDVLDSVNNFYSNQKITKAVSIDKITNDQPGWKNLYEDREKSLAIKTNIVFVLDKYYENQDEVSLLAYKLMDYKPFSYVIIKGRKLKDRVSITSIIDPFL